MAIPAVIAVITVLALLIFSYSRSLTASHRLIKRIQLGTMCSHIAIGCANVVAKYMETEADSIYEELSRGYLSRYSFLIEKRIAAGDKLDIPIPTANVEKYEKLVRDMVHSISLDGQQFNFKGLKVYFDDVSRIVTFESPTFSYQDWVEKQGFLSIEVTISTSKGFTVSKSAKIKRPFKVVNLLPPILSKFCLFVAQTPTAEAYNTVVFSEAGKPSPVPLVIQAGPQPIVYSSPPNLRPDGLELQLGGWIYLGPTNDEVNDNVFLNIADGYSGKGAQMFLFGKDPGNAIIRYSTHNPPGLNHWLNDTPYPVLLFQHFEGINTTKQLEYNHEKIFGAKIPIFTSWLQPFGDASRLSRTLVGGPVFGRVLKIMELSPFSWKIDGSGKVQKVSDPVEATKEAWGKRFAIPSTPPDFNDVLPSVISILYDKVKAAGGDVKQIPNKWKDVFTAPGKYIEFASKEILIPFNQFFDLVRHPMPPVLNLPSWFYVGIDPNDQTHIIPESIRGIIRTVSPPPIGAPPCAYLARDNFSFGYSQGEGKEFFKFSGDLRQFKTRNLAPALFEGRATKKFTLSGSTNAAERKILGDLLLTDEKTLDLQGIILVNRSPGNPSGGPLSLPSDLKVNNNVTLVFDRGDLQIDGVTMASPDKHLVLVLLDGSFHITEKQINAYLVALKPPVPGSPKPPGRLISADGKALQVVGGIAVQELGIPEPGSSEWSNFFKNGGKLAYNHTLNPCNYWYEDYYSLFLSDCSPYLEVIEQ